MKHMKWFILLLTFCTLCSLIISGCGGGGTNSVNPPVVPTEITPAPVVTEIPTAPPQPVDTVTGYVLSKTGGEASLNDVILIVSANQPSIENYSPLSSAKVYLASNPSIETTTDRTGRFTLNNVPYSQVDILTQIIVETNDLQSKDFQVKQHQFGVVTGPDGQVKGTKTIPVSSMPVSPGDNRQVHGYGVNNQNQVIRPNQGTWSSTIGQIGNNTGIFKAPPSSGSGTIIYTDQGVSSVINVEVVSNNNLGTISGTVTYSDGSPASGVIVSIDGLTVASKTDSGGQYSLTKLPAGQNTLIASYNGVNSGSATATVVGGQNNVVNIKLNIGQNTPVISSIYPNAAPVGSSVKIDGNNFGSSGTVTFNGVSAQIISWTVTSVTVVLPSVQSGTANVLLTSGGQNSNSISINIVDGPTPTHTPTPANTFTPTPANTFTPTPANTFTPTPAIPNYVLINRWGSQGSGNGQFDTPRYLALDSSGNVYVTDSNNNRVQKFNSSGGFITKWGSWGAGNGQFSRPEGIAVDSSGNVYVAEFNNNRVQKFNSSGGFITKWGSYGTANGQFSNPIGMTVDSSGNIYVADYGNNRIQKFSFSGEFLTKWGSYGTSDGQFRGSTDIALDPSGRNAYVSEESNNCIQKFESDWINYLNFVLKWGSSGTGNGQFSSPYGITVDQNNNVYVSDTSNGRIQKFNSSGGFIQKWGSSGTGIGQLNSARGIVVNSSGTVYIADTDNYRIQVFQPTM